DSTAADSVLAGVGSLFASLDSIANLPNEDGRRVGIRAFLESNRISTTPASIALLLDTQSRSELEEAINEAVRELFPNGVAPSSIGQGVSTVRVEMPNGIERLVPRDSLLTPDRFYTLAADRLENEQVEAAELLRLILIRFFEPSLVFDE